MVIRWGHSLVEVLVVTVVLSVGIGGTASSVAAGGRWSSQSEQRQRALSEVRAVLDSLGTTAAPASGAAALEGLELRWEVTRAGTSLWHVEVVGVRPDGAELLRLSTLLTPLLPTLRDAAASVGGTGGAP